ncbi:AraC family transcriptional regulator [Roseateles sp.]|uniref:AraC family transcriptional regulator n=1 Tax=Roseateles sp. TaxID=1971397 RepID=UPI0025E122A7|nr:AraC family transcriptional regulator [Roseateles sp.]MBV8033513.1 AraC family transcriptional regulator [Roseateles sp.]
MLPRGFTLIPSHADGIEAVTADSALAFGRHTHGEFGIGLIERGAQKSASGRGVVEAAAGDVITVNPGEVHDGTPLAAGGRRWRMLYISPTLVLDAADDISPGAAFEFTAPVLRDAVLAARFRALFDAATVGRRAWCAEAGLLELVAGLLRPATTRAAVHAGVAAARERMDDDPAADAGLSRYQFLRAFTRLTGLPPHAYRLQRRVQRARQLVRGGLPLADAAAASGFADQSHMTRCFVRSYGLTPGACMRR